MRELEIVGVFEIATREQIEEWEKDPNLFEFYSPCADTTYCLKEAER